MKDSTKMRKLLIIILCIVLLPTGPVLAVQQPPASSSEQQIEAAQKQMEGGQFAAALELLRPLLSGDLKTPPEVFVLMATCHLNLNQTEQSLELCERGVVAYPAETVNAEFYLTVLKRYVPAQRMKEQLERAITRVPESVVLTRGLAVLELQRDHRSERALQLAEKLLELAPNDPMSHYVHGEWAFLNHREAKAIEEWEKTLALAGNPDPLMLTDVYTLIGDAERRLEHPERAEAAFRKALDANVSLQQPKPASAFFYADFLAEQGRAEESQKVIDQVLAWAPNYGPALLSRASFFSRQKKWKEAVEAAKGSLAGTDMSPEQTRAAHLVLAKSYFLLGEKDKAAEHQKWLQSQ